ncbi:1,6-anhydro-N-acetylmuramyl-L-alanine amidase AmpD [Psychromonas aquimarina]|uniref:1,6-anhydro-N-acetylmuramyl-L-alanine amidase AmpD n=1 Tax=Psychromonas aquimarina TaxID=444919 RepID=UPI00041BEB31|nr:1,6-anhydro-N-acetylmuramyl-L-alanine amidase AmpD [Psychromonas aquimarina]
MIDKFGIYPAAKQIRSPFYNERPADTQISLLVIHCISLPEGVYGGRAVEQLFSGCLDCSEDSGFADLQGLEVSAHCVIRRDGQIEQYVPFVKRAWHAGVSCFAGIEGCNDYSIGIELEGTDHSTYTNEQYLALSALTTQIQLRYPAITTERITGHSDIAPGRKTDPGRQFDWAYYFRLLAD